jgi:hypothetical protein
MHRLVSAGDTAAFHRCRSEARFDRAPADAWSSSEAGAWDARPRRLQGVRSERPPHDGVTGIRARPKASVARHGSRALRPVSGPLRRTRCRWRDPDPEPGCVGQASVLPAGVPALPGRHRLTSPATSVSTKIVAEEHLEDGEDCPMVPAGTRFAVPGRGEGRVADRGPDRVRPTPTTFARAPASTGRAPSACSSLDRW